MGKRYTPSASLNAAFDIIIAKPIDIRFVVDTYSELINPATWGYWDTDLEMWLLTCYKGLITAVVDDPDDSKNGVYYIKNNNFETSPWMEDPSYTMTNDWVKIGGNLFNLDQYTIKNNTDTYQSNDTQASGLHVVRIDGGSY